MPKLGLVDETDEEYHAERDSFSKSFLWDIEKKTPYRARYEKHENKPHFSIGKAAHVAILEPERLEAAVMRGPEDRRGNKWKEAEDFAAYSHKILLTAGDHDMALMIRDVAATIPELDTMREVDDDGRGPMVEQSCYAVDEKTGLTVRCRPDLYNPKHRLIVDIKNMADASPEGWSKSIGDFGYHLQDPIYTEIFGSVLPVEGFWFLVFQKSEPPEVALYELTAEDVAEGHARYRHALETTAECVKTDVWPSYSTAIQRVGMKPWAYKLTTPPERRN